MEAGVRRLTGCREGRAACLREAVLRSPAGGSGGSRRRQARLGQASPSLVGPCARRRHPCSCAWSHIPHGQTQPRPRQESSSGAPGRVRGGWYRPRGAGPGRAHQGQIGLVGAALITGQSGLVGAVLITGQRAYSRRRRAR